MTADEYETDLSGEMQEARELAHKHDCEMRDCEQGIQPLPEEDEQ